MDGLGSEDLEGCERLFSKSNALAPSIRYASIFHRGQAILEYYKHMDRFETSQNSSAFFLTEFMLVYLSQSSLVFPGRFILNNYKQALVTIDGEKELLEKMSLRGLSGTETFAIWLEEERKYLSNLRSEPIEETLHMDYYLALVDLSAAE